MIEKDELSIPGEQIVTQECEPEADTEHARVEADDVEVSEQVLAGEDELL